MCFEIVLVHYLLHGKHNIHQGSNQVILAHNTSIEQDKLIKEMHSDLIHLKYLLEKYLMQDPLHITRQTCLPASTFHHPLGQH